MRLTLRTLLAYMDSILAPEDSQLIGKKIEESEFASNLLHRVRDCMRRLRLGAPAVLDQGKGLDPNTVAEYLDNTLPGDQVADFERVCLESDVHLAEVASCHQILTMVLGEPAEVDPESRVRMYGLSEQATAPPLPPELPPAPPTKPEVQKGPPPVQQQPAAAQAKPQLPDYLRSTLARRRRLWIAAATILVLALGVGLLVPSGPRDSFLARLGLQRQPPFEEPAAVSPAKPALPPVEKPTGPPAPPSEAAAPLTPAEEPTAEPSSPAAEVSPLPEPETASAEPAGQAPEPGAPEPGASEPLPAEQPPKPEAVASIPEAPLPVPPAEPSAAQPPAELVVDPAAEPAPLPRETVGRFASATEVLLRRDPKDGTWRRLTDQAPLVSGDVFLALPTYRPLVMLGDQVRVLLVDETRVRLLPPDAQGTLGVECDYGRLLLRTAGQAETRLRLKLGNHSGVITFGDADSAAAVEVSQPGPSIVDPELNALPLSAELFAVSGKIIWEDPPSGGAIAVAAPGCVRVDQAPLEVGAVEELPAWTAGSTVGLLDQRASGTVESQISADRPAGLALRELAVHRQREVRRLALRCLAAMGDFEPLVQALNDADQRMIWPDYFPVDLLQSAIARSPQAAADLRAVMEKLHRGEGAKLYALLWRYGDDKLDRDEASQLVDYLDHDALSFRRLSFWNLRRITGMGLYYEPESTSAERRTAVQRWRERIEQIAPAAAQPSAPEVPVETSGVAAP